eukprot:434707-Rhodomonas_salina.1
MTVEKGRQGKHCSASTTSTNAASDEDQPAFVLPHQMHPFRPGPGTCTDFTLSFQAFADLEASDGPDSHVAM